jgi:hypothetical protein
VRRVCQFCGNVFGYKCHECGEPLVHYRGHLLWECLKCDKRRRKATGGDSHGTCQACCGKRKP